MAFLSLKYYRPKYLSFLGHMTVSALLLKKSFSFHSVHEFIKSIKSITAPTISYSPLLSFLAISPNHHLSFLFSPNVPAAEISSGFKIRGNARVAELFGLKLWLYKLGKRNYMTAQG
eukprot:Sdes_comp17187_c0_seq1m6358